MALYAQIVGVVVPSKALEGETVNVTVKVKNLYNAGAITIQVTGGYDSTPLPSSAWTPPYAQVLVGKTQDFTNSFLMPGEGITLGVYAYYYDYYDGVWLFDDQKYINIALGSEEPPEPPSKIPWLAIVGIGGAALLGIMLVRR